MWRVCHLYSVDEDIGYRIMGFPRTMVVNEWLSASQHPSGADDLYWFQK
jgi:hypothetical protein